MRLKLKNIGIIKEADITLDGLTVIAGENDSGKSTIGKVLYSLVRILSKPYFESKDTDLSLQYLNPFNDYIDKLFKSQISQNGNIEFNYDDNIYDIAIVEDRCHKFGLKGKYEPNIESITTPLFIDSPFIWNMMSSLKTIGQLEKKIDVDFEVLETITDLYFVLTTKSKELKTKIKLNIETIIKGNIVETNLGEFSFHKENKNIELINTAMGIKYFGILQVLSDKNHFYNGQILILDEPEVHLHPKWQLELAKVIVYLVSKGVKVLVNSHSPYMIEALQRYSKKKNISNNFYLADECKIIEDDQALSKIFAKLSEPFDEFDKMDSEALNG